MKRISPDITDEAKIILDKLCMERQRGMGAVVSELILASSGGDKQQAAMLQHLTLLHEELATLLAYVEKACPLPPVTEESPVLGVRTDAERYGANFVQPVVPLPAPEPVRRGVLQRILYAKE